MLSAFLCCGLQSTVFTAMVPQSLLSSSQLPWSGLLLLWEAPVCSSLCIAPVVKVRSDLRTYHSGKEHRRAGKRLLASDSQKPPCRNLWNKLPGRYSQFSPEWESSVWVRPVAIAFIFHWLPVTVTIFQRPVGGLFSKDPRREGGRIMHRLLSFSDWRHLWVVSDNVFSLPPFLFTPVTWPLK